MLGKTTLKALNRSADVTVFALALAGGCFVSLLMGRFPEFASVSAWLTCAFAMLYYGINIFYLYLFGAYPTTRLRTLNQMREIYLKSTLMALMTVFALTYAILPHASNRTALVLSSFFAYFLLMAKERLFRLLLAHIRKTGYNRRNAILIGPSPEQIKELSVEVAENHLLGIDLVGFLSLSSGGQEPICGIKNLGTLADLGRVVVDLPIDCAIFFNPVSQDDVLKDAVWKCEQTGLEVWLTLDVFDQSVTKINVERLKRVTFLNFQTGPRNRAALLVKYAFDRLASVLLLALLSPLFLLIAIVIKSTSPGPVFFKQYRASINGRKFVFFKFRSMIQNAEQYKESLRQQNEMRGPVFKMKNDPRITPIGRILRKTSLDELPQLINVALGDMSLVGPRPLPILEAQRIEGWRRRRMSMKPGITCLWQVEGRNRIVDFEDWAKLDLKYIDHWSLWLDFKILLKTIPAVLRCTGI